MVEAPNTVNFEPCIGIDLGTTNTCVALWNPENQAVEILVGSDGKRFFPSWVAYGDDGSHITVGGAAHTKENIFYDIKRVIGQSFADLKKDKKF